MLHPFAGVLFAIHTNAGRQGQYANVNTLHLDSSYSSIAFFLRPNFELWGSAHGESERIAR